jgi:hypothetical protein
MNHDDRHPERRPAVSPEDVRIAREVSACVRTLRERYPTEHICGDYHSSPIMIIVRVVDPTSAEVLAEEWIAR